MIEKGIPSYKSCKCQVRVMNMHVILRNHKLFIWLKPKYVGKKDWK